MIQEEINEFWTAFGDESDLENARLDEKSDTFAIIQWVLMRSGVEDIYAQFQMIQEFASAYIQEGDTLIS